MRIGIIGAGHVGTTLGRGWAKAGHDIVYGVRDSAPVTSNPGARVASVRGAVEASEVVVLAVPWAAAPDALAAAGDLGGKPLVDVTNPIGPGFTLTHGHTTSGAEQVAGLARNARVIKAFNSTGLENMANPAFGDRRVVMPIAGDDAGAVAVASTLATDLGFESVSLKGLVRARELEPLAMLWIKLAVEWGLGRGIGFAIAKGSSEGRAPSRSATERPRKIAIVGSGNIGGALARAWLRSGHEVLIAARDPGGDGISALVELGAKVSPVASAARESEIVVFAIPAGAVVPVAKEMGGLEGKIVVDCTNAIAKGFALQYGHTTSSSEEVSRALAGARVVRSFNQQGAEVLEHAVFAGLRATNFVASDDSDARRIVAALASDVGLDAVEAGPLASSRYLEPITLLWVAMAQAIGTRDFGLSLLRR